MRYIQISNPKWLAKEIENKPLRQIANEVGCSYSAVVYQVKKHGLTVPQRFTHRPSPTKSANIKKTFKERFPEGRFGENASNWKGGRHKFKNVTTGPNKELTITGGWLRDSSTGLSITTVDTTGYTIFNAPDHVVAYATSGGGTNAKYLNTSNGDLLLPLT